METYEEQHIPMTSSFKEYLTKEKVKELTDLATYIVYASDELYENGLIPFELYRPAIEKVYWKRPLLYNEKEYGLDITVIAYNETNKKRTKIMVWYRLYENGKEKIAITIPEAETIWYDYKEFLKALEEIRHQRNEDKKFDINKFTIRNERDLLALNFILQNNEILYKKEIANSELETIKAEIREAGLEETLEKYDVHLLVVEDKANTILYVLKRK
ncbi:MAG: hypothetical protein QXS21_06560 [Thermoproteota archaeon]